MDNKILWIFIHPIRSGGNTLIEFIKKNVPKDSVYLPSNVRYGHKGFLPFNKKKTLFALGHATYYGIHKLAPDKEARYFIFLRDPAERLVSYYNAKMEDIEERDHGKKIPFDVWYKNQMKEDLINFLDLKYRGSESSRVHAPKFFMPVIKRLNYKSFYLLQTLALKFKRKNKKLEAKKLENAKKLLDVCWFVGIVEKSEEDFKFLLEKMGFKNFNYINDGAAKKIIKINDALRQKIYKDNPLDYELYKYALKLREEKINLIKKNKRSI